MKNEQFSAEVKNLLAEKPRWWVRSGNLFVLVFLAAVLLYLGNLKTTERRSFPVYLVSTGEGSYQYKAMASLSPQQLADCELQLNETTAGGMYKLPSNAIVTDSAIVFSMPVANVQALQPAQPAGTLVYINRDVSILRCFVNQLFR